MKKLLAIVVAVLFLVPAVGLSLESMKTRAKIGRDSEGGYSENQKDYKKRMHERDQNKQRSGYYEGAYHNQSPEFKQGEYQFIDSGSKAHPKKKHKKKAE